MIPVEDFTATGDVLFDLETVPTDLRSTEGANCEADVFKFDRGDKVFNESVTCLSIWLLCEGEVRVEVGERV